MATAFERLIEHVPQDSVVLDVGAGGCEGENTSNYLVRRFKKYTGVNIKHSSDIDRWVMNNPDVEMLFQDFFALERKCDFLVFDATIEKQLEQWSQTGLSGLGRFINSGGYLAMYIMTDPNYGDENIHKLLRENRDEWWGSWDKEDIVKKLKNLDGFTFIALEQEERRPEIYWSLLKHE